MIELKKIQLSALLLQFNMYYMCVKIQVLDSIHRTDHILINL